MTASNLYNEFETFLKYWDNYTIEEKRIINNDFKKRSFEINIKPLEI